MSIAFFDVDETLIRVKSMFRFLEFHLNSPRRYREAAGELHRLTAAGAPREETNRLYYRNFAGQRAADVAASGRRWFDRELSTGTLFHPEMVRELRRHQESGTITALVSGSFAACLDPIAEYLRADHVLGTIPGISDGRYTGRVLRTVIGEGKASAVLGLMAELGAAAADCVAYADHESDLPMLRSVGNAGVVGEDPVLRAQAARYGWRRFAASTGLISEGAT